MTEIYIYRRNYSGTVSPEYKLQNLIFQNFYLGQKRDETDLRIVRRYAEGTLLIKDADFNSLKEYFNITQKGTLHYNSVTYNCLFTFTNVNYTSKKAQMTVTVLDDYSELYDITNYNISKVPKKDIGYTEDDIYNSLTKVPEHYFIDGSSYRHGSLWGFETVTDNDDKDVKLDNIYAVNKKTEDITASDLFIRTDLLNDYYKPYVVYYSDWHTGSKKFKHQSISYIREYRYFAESEDSKGWHYTSTHTIINGITFNKYVREYYKGQTYLDGKEVYRMYEQTSPALINLYFNGKNTDLQKDTDFIKLDEVLELLIEMIYPSYITFNLYGLSDIYINSLYNYNSLNYKKIIYKFSEIINFLRDKFGLYFQINGTDYGFYPLEYNNFTTELLKIEDYRGKNWFPNEAVQIELLPEIYEFISISKRLDFANQKVSFFNNNKTIEQISEGVITDTENKEETDNFIVIDTKETSINQIYEKMTVHPNYQIGQEGCYPTEDGSALRWHSTDLDDSPYIRIKYLSNHIYHKGTATINLQFGVKVSDGSVNVSFGSYNQTFTADASVNTNITSTAGSDQITIYIDNSGGGQAQGLIYGLSAYLTTKRPKAETGIITQNSILNGSLANANKIKSRLPQMSYKEGYLEKYGNIDTSVKFHKGITINIPLSDDAFNLDFKKYMSLNSEKYIIFERKRQIFDENKESNIDIVKLKSNEVY